MIKDRAIQKRIKGNVVAMAMTAVMASLFVPIKAEAAFPDTTISSADRQTMVLTEDYKWYIIDKDGVEGNKSTQTCLGADGKCAGHKFIGGGTTTTGLPYAIKVAGGDHKIILQNVNIDLQGDTSNAPPAALDVAKKATVDLTLLGTNTLTSARTRAGIAVPEGATLTIHEDKDQKGGSLTVQSPYGASGIGGEGISDTMSAGTITIDSGTIKATGGAGGAGIGGSAKGGAGTITINGGDVTAIGGDGSNIDTDERGKGAPGIGSGSGGNINSGTVSINVDNKRVYTIGGKGQNGGPQAYGISASELISTVGNSIEILTNSLNPGMSTNKFNGLVWTSATKDENDNFSTGNVCIAYNQAIMPNNFQLLSKQTLSIYDPASVTIPSSKTGWTFWGEITGDGTLVNADKVTKEEGAILKDTLNLKVILASDDIKATTPSQIFTGADLRSKVYTVAKSRYNEGLDQTFEVDTTGWKITFKKDGVALPEEEGKNVQIIDAGNYDVIYSKTGCADAIGKFVVLPREITECKVAPDPLEDKEYIGKDHTPAEFKLDLTYDGRPLNKADYNWKLTAGKNTDVGKGEIEIKPGSSGNLTADSKGPLIVTYNIKATSLENAKVELSFKDGKSNITYDGDEHRPTSIKVTLDSIKTDENPDGTVPDTAYDVEYSCGNDFTSAGKITVTVTGKGNFTGTATAEYEIKRITLGVTSITGEGRKYNGSTDIKITDLKVDLANVREEDKKDPAAIVVDPSAITGTLPFPDAGTYTQVILKNQFLSGSLGKNYSIDGTYTLDSNILTDEITIIQRDAPALELGGTYTESSSDPNTFRHTVTIKGADPEEDIIDPGSDVWLCMDAENPDVNDPTVWTVKGQWVALDPEKPEELTLVGIFDGIVPETTHTFYAYTGLTKNVAKSETPGHCTKDFEKLPQDPPESCELTISDVQNADGETFTGTVTPIEEGRYLYSYDGGTEYVSSNTFEGYLPGTKYVAYIKYAATPTRKESEGTASNEVTTNKLQAKQPNIALATGGTTFRGRANVVMSYPTSMPGIRIYYTTNGNEPNENSTLYSGEQFSISDTTTIKAIAVSDTLDKSEPIEVTFEKTGDTEVQSIVDLKVGLTDNMISTILGKRLDEDTIADSAETVETFMTALLSAIPGYVNQNVKVYDLTIRIAIYDERGQIIEWVTPEEQDFPIKVNLTYEQLQLPEGVSGTTHDFAVTHMFAQEMRNHVPGETEEPTVEKTDKGISFYVDGASPLAVAWKTAGSTDPNTPDNPDDPNNPDNPNNPDDPNNPDNPNNPDDPNNPNNPDDPNNSNAQNNPDDSTNPDGTGSNGTTSSTDPTTQGAAGTSTGGALSSIMPKTGDPISFIPWIAAAVVCIGVIVGLAKKKGGAKKSPKKNTKKTTKKTTQTKSKKK